jgi:hypothetical protein
VRYPHWITVTTPTEPTPESGSGDGGGFGEVAPPAAPLAPTVLLDCPCDCQDVGEVRPRNASGLPANRADATVFVRDEFRVFDIPAGAEAAVQFAPHAADVRPWIGHVTYARELDGALLVRFPDAG